jgi:hypothetical protein
MKRHPSEEQFCIAGQATALPPLSYAQELRAIGQALEARTLVALDLERLGDIYVARGTIGRKGRAGFPLLDSLRDAISSALHHQDGGQKAGGGLEMRFSSEQIHALELQGRARRRDSNQTPDAHSLSQMLRGAGAYLDARHRISLVGVNFRDRWLTLRYKTADGRLEQAVQDIEFFYNLWVKMYLQRSNRRPINSPGPG